MKAAAYVLVLLVVVALSVQGYAQAPGDKLIVPGQRIGKWTLDMTIDDFVRMNGPRNVNGGYRSLPVERANAEDSGWANNVYIHSWDNLSMAVATLGENSKQVVLIFVRSGDYKTAKGLSVDTPLQGVEALYGKPTYLQPIVARRIYEEIGLI